ncbi:putative serine/threonine-protein kinase [Hibiscus syriacus]|uniref:non-specific serine/threonine protein kinase n=1 Tax=Hibiscus syriacus TaxID=106335 RepID=A0A6A2Y5J8_HIBSY|nr:putative serine/threonine-protein kinase [Hibiscus syriacus]
MAVYDVEFLNAELSKPTSIFGLRLWVLIGVLSSSLIVVALFLISLCLTNRRKSARHHHLEEYPSPPISKEFQETVSHQPASDHHRIAQSVAEVQVVLTSGESRGPPLTTSAGASDTASLGSGSVGPEVSHLGWGRWYTLRELELATNGLCEENVIGEGGYGIVYSGVLSDGAKVAVKNLLNNRGQAVKEFKVEVEAIGRARHKNLVRLHGYCAEGAIQWLHGEVGDVSPLTWDIRMNIILGTAKGLAYLHEGLEPKVVHRDVKASNILLDCQWNPKVSDFGLAKLLCSERTYVTTRVMGTFGYVAPEYACTGMLNEKSDVYSFGVNLVEWLKTMVGNRKFKEVVDPKLPQMPASKALKRILLVALRCVDPDASKRPKMGHVIHMLESDDLLFHNERRIANDQSNDQQTNRHATKFGDQRFDGASASRTREGDSERNHHHQPTRAMGKVFVRFEFFIRGKTFRGSSGVLPENSQQQSLSDGINSEAINDSNLYKASFDTIMRGNEEDNPIKHYDVSKRHRINSSTTVVSLHPDTTPIFGGSTSSTNKNESTVKRLRHFVRSVNPSVVFLIETKLHDGNSWRCTGFYGAPEERLRESLWNLLCHLNDCSHVPRMVIGDFNELMFTTEKRGGLPRSEHQIQGFRSALLDCQLSYLGYTSDAFKLEHLTYSFSDHCPLMVYTCPMIAATNKWHFKFEADWLLDDSCASEVSRFKKITCNDLHHRLAELLNTHPTDEVLGEILEVKLALNLEAEKDEIYWEQRDRSMSPVKASGKDGLGAVFYQRFWHVLGQEIFAYCIDVLSGVQDIAEINQTRIVLIPKPPVLSAVGSGMIQRSRLSTEETLGFTNPREILAPSCPSNCSAVSTPTTPPLLRQPLRRFYANHYAVMFPSHLLPRHRCFQKIYTSRSCYIPLETHRGTIEPKAASWWPIKGHRTYKDKEEERKHAPEKNHSSQTLNRKKKRDREYLSIVVGVSTPHQRLESPKPPCVVADGGARRRRTTTTVVGIPSGDGILERV